MTNEERTDTLPSDQEEGEEEMVYIPCVQCDQARESTYLMKVECGRVGDIEPSVELRGLLTCGRDGHQTPVHMRDGVLEPPTRTSYLLRVSEGLRSKVKIGIKQDVEQAEQAHFAFCYKASVVMCRRALQQSLIAKGMKDDAFGRMLIAAKPDPDGNGTISTWDAWYRAEKVKVQGDSGAHAEAEFDPEQVSNAIYDTVAVVNEIFVPTQPSEPESPTL